MGKATRCRVYSKSDNCQLDLISMLPWKISGLVATIVIVLSIPLYLMKVSWLERSDSTVETADIATFVGRGKCVSCHKREYENWRGSHHDDAMAEANEETVLGDFDDTVFAHNGVTSRFYRRGGEFFVNTKGPDGKPGDFKITHAFGITPLQQYLVPMDGGRLQCLAIAWDVAKKTWYHLNPDETIAASEWLHWTQQSHNWNGMCADCHSTNLQKNFDSSTDTYRTTWSEIDVSCEACHGPGSRHMAWADLPEMARSVVDNFRLVVDTGGMVSEQQVEQCAKCHARRLALGDFSHGDAEMMDDIIPELLGESLYYPDGQILDEVYVYGSFVQSKMYMNQVKCGDCHDVHSLKTVQKGNKLCLQCHRAVVYDTGDHHFHKKRGEAGDGILSETGKVLSAVGEGAECVKCHMPGRYYMGPDYRLDHSMRIPRPDLSIELGVPNACNLCHQGKTTKWAADRVDKWYGISRKHHYGTTLAAGRQRLPAAKKELILLADDALTPVMVRATALMLLGAYPGRDARAAFIRALDNAQALIRHTAVRHFNPPNPDERLKLLAPLLDDPIRSVRMDAAMNLALVPINRFNPRQEKAFWAALQEYQDAMEYSADFSFSGLNLGNMHSYLGELNSAEKKYREALEIAQGFNAAKVNLAMLLNRRGKNKEAESLLRQVVTVEPESYEILYTLGLLLAEEKKYAQAAENMAKAAKGLPTRARIHYNLGLLMQQLQKNDEAEAAFLKALELEPDNIDFLYAFATHFLKKGELRKASIVAQRMVEKHPSHPLTRKLVSYLSKNPATSRQQ